MSFHQFRKDILGTSIKLRLENDTVKSSLTCTAQVGSSGSTSAGWDSESASQSSKACCGSLHAKVDDYPKHTSPPMSENGFRKSKGKDALLVESLFVTLLLFISVQLPPNWRYFWLFHVALVGVVLTMIFRAMADQANNPSVDAVRGSIRWASRLLHMGVVGAVVAISFHLSEWLGIFSNVVTFAGVGVAIALAFALLDIWFLGEFGRRWREITHEHTGENPIGQALRHSVDYGVGQIESAADSDAETPDPEIYRPLRMSIGLLILALIVSIPIWGVLSLLTSNLTVAILTVVAVYALRSTPRYIYLQYGGVEKLSDLSGSSLWEAIWILMVAAVAVASLGYSFTVNL